MSTALEEAVLKGLGRGVPQRLGVAVSGGSDSLALLHVLHALSRTENLVLEAASVDHGLRPGSADEAAGVAAICADLGVPHTILRWQGWDRRGNLQDHARRARYGLLAQWARQAGLDAVCLGHTQEDQAETVLMRLARRSGVDGLSAMAPRMQRDGMLWLRPCLDVTREALRAYLATRGIGWVDDPSNADPRFERVKARKALALLGDLGIDAEVLAEVAAHQREARVALESATQLIAQDCVTHHHGALSIDRAALARVPAEIQRRLLGAAIRWITGAPYGTRAAPLQAMVQAACAGQGMTLGGAAVLGKGDRAWVFREYAPVRDLAVAADAVWDDRWRIAPGSARPPTGARIAALGEEGLALCPDWRDLGMPRAALLSHPGLWQGDTLVASPAVKTHPTWHWQLIRDADALFSGPL